MYINEKTGDLTGLIYGYSTIDEGNMSFKFGHKSQVVKARKKFLKKLNISISDCVAMWVEHGDTYEIAGRKWAGKSAVDNQFVIHTDALITNQRKLFLLLLVADCIPLILYERKNRVLSLLHVGWRNVDVGLVSKVIKKLIGDFSVNPADLICVIGPAARKDSYIKRNPLQLQNQIWKDFLFKAQEEYYKVDFVGLCKKQLVENKVLEKNIIDCGIDTVKDDRFYSHYRDSMNGCKDQGRFACIVGLI